MTYRRTFTAKSKTQVMLELLTGAKSIARICREQELKDKLMYRWKAQFLERADTIFSGDTEQQAEERIGDFEGLIGRLTMELEIMRESPRGPTH